jgi:hypothetical protein
MTTPTGWTVETLREHVLSLFDAVRTEIAASKDAATLALTAVDRAVQKAEAAAEKRFESVNEFRNTLADQQRTLMPRAETEIRFDALQKRLEAIEQRQLSVMSTGVGLRDGWGYAVGAIGLIGGLIAALSNR